MVLLASNISLDLTVYLYQLEAITRVLIALSACVCVCVYVCVCVCVCMSAVTWHCTEWWVKTLEGGVVIVKPWPCVCRG